jgi:hypothetical protein
MDKETSPLILLTELFFSHSHSSSTCLLPSVESSTNAAGLNLCSLSVVCFFHRSLIDASYGYV